MQEERSKTSSWILKDSSKKSYTVYVLRRILPRHLTKILNKTSYQNFCQDLTRLANDEILNSCRLIKVF